MYHHFRNHDCRISDQWAYKGMRTLIMENNLLRVVILLDKGSDIIEFRYKPLDLNFMYTSPSGIRNPRLYTPSAYNDQAFLDYYSGGWNEILPNGGPHSIHAGAEHGQHGEISLIPWDCVILEDTPKRISAWLSVRPLRTPFLLQKTLTLENNSAALVIEETLTNEAGEPLHFMWGQHIAFGLPFLQEGARIDVPARRFLVNPAMPGYEPRRFKPGVEADWPQVPSPEDQPVDASRVPAYGETQAQVMGYITELEAGWYALTNTERQVGFGVHFDPELYRYIWYWQQLGGVARGFPWWGRTHTAALEPWTSYPTDGLAAAVDNGTARMLQPGEQLHTRFVAAAYAGKTRVSRVNADGSVD